MVSRARMGRRPFPRAPEVFENSTACATEGSIESDVASRFEPSPSEATADQEHPSSPRSASVYERRPRSTDLTTLQDLCRLGGTSVFYGEFDPGSGRTLAACLTHASGATNQASAWGKAANG